MILLEVGLELVDTFRLTAENEFCHKSIVRAILRNRRLRIESEGNVILCTRILLSGV